MGMVTWIKNMIDTFAVFQHFKNLTLKHTGGIAVVLEQFIVIWLFFRKPTFSSCDWNFVY